MLDSKSSGPKTPSVAFLENKNSHSIHFVDLQNPAPTCQYSAVHVTRLHHCLYLHNVPAALMGDAKVVAPLVLNHVGLEAKQGTPNILERGGIVGFKGSGDGVLNCLQATLFLWVDCPPLEAIK